MNELLIHRTTWLILKGSMLSEEKLILMRYTLCGYILYDSLEVTKLYR
jgi:hypothetical protein